MRIPRIAQTCLFLPLALPLVVSCGGGSGGGTPPPTPAVTSPQAGDALSGMHTITWVAPQNAATVTIALSSDGGQSFPTTLATGVAASGDFTWDTTSESDAAMYRISVTPFDGGGQAGAAFANSGSFTVDNTTPTLVLDSPQGGGIFGGTEATVQWTTTDDNPGTVEVRVSSDSGATYPMVVAAAAPDNGEFKFDATSMAEGLTYRVRVTPTDLAGNVGGSDESSGDVELDNTVPTITLTSPVGGEMLASVHNITYTMMDANADRVEIFLSDDSGATFGTTVALDATPAGPYVWNTALFEDGTTYRIRVVGVDAAGNRSLPSDSGADFTLENIVLKQNAYFTDTNDNGLLDMGDTIFLAFNEEIVLNGPTEADFEMYVTGDSLGTGGTFTDLNLVGWMSIDVGTGAAMKVRGEFDPDVTAAGSPSGMDVAFPVTPDSIENVLGTDVAPIGGVDIESGFVEARSEAGSDMGTSCDAGDLDGDGDIDFVIGRDAGLGVAIRLRNALGEYPLSGGSPLGTDTVTDVALGDVDGDGDLDLVSGNNGPNRIYLNDGFGGFVNSGQVLGTGNTLSVALGDLDGDGDLDLVCGNDFATQVRTYTNNGSGTFTQTSETLGGFNSNDLALGDIDSDGDLDVVVGNEGPGMNRAWINNGSGSFSQGSTVTAALAKRIVLGDLDGDGDLDAVIGVLGQNEVALNNGNGVFTATGQVFSNGDTRGLALYDFDGDGDLDGLFTKNQDRDELWLNDGTGFFVRRMPQNIGNKSSADIAIGDFDNDGDMDYFAPGNQPNDDTVWHNSVSGVQGSTLLVEGAAVDASTEDTWATAGIDANRDGNMDVLAVRDAGVHWLSGVGDGTFVTSGAVMGTVTGSGSLLVADFDRDGNDDFVQVAGGNVTNLFLGDGTGDFSLAAMAFGMTQATSIAAGDLDGDGDMDVILGQNGADDLVYLNNGNGVFTETGSPIVGFTTEALALADIDLDGDLDAIVGTDAGLRLETNDGSGGFTSIVAAVGADDVESLRIADLNGDGISDVISGNDGTASRVWVGDGASGFPTNSTFGPALATSLAQSLAVYDANHDGTLDVAYADGPDMGSAIFLGSAGGFPAAGQALGAANIVSGHVPADFDGDGDIDLFEARVGGADVLWTID